MKEECLEIFNGIGEEQTPQRPILVGEDILFESYNASDNGLPNEIRFATYVEIKEEIRLSTQRLFDQIEIKKRYLWVLKDNKIHIALEATPNNDSERKCICHSNITKGEPAVVGGELWFTNNPEEKVYLNFKSGRYPLNDPAKASLVKDLFECVGYAKVELLTI